MRKTTGVLIAGFAVLALAATAPLAAAECGVVYRIWQKDKEARFYNYGEDVTLEPGEAGDLYIHYESRTPGQPYRTSAVLGAPTDFGVGGQRFQDIRKVLRVDPQSPSNARHGKLPFVAVHSGLTAIGYRITALNSPGRLENVPEKCRVGQVRVHVSGGAPQPVSDAGPLSRNEAAHQLIVKLYQDILRRTGVADYPDSFFEAVQQKGLPGLADVAEQMTASREFHVNALGLTRQALAASGVAADSLSDSVLQDQLLTDIYRSLYGSNSPPATTRQAHLGQLSACFAAGPGETICRSLGRSLINQYQYSQHHNELLKPLGYGR